MLTSYTHTLSHSPRFYDKAHKIDALDFFKQFAVSPDALPDTVFASIGRTTWRDIGPTAISFRVLMKVGDGRGVRTRESLSPLPSHTRPPVLTLNPPLPSLPLLPLPTPPRPPAADPRLQLPRLFDIQLFKVHAGLQEAAGGRGRGGGQGQVKARAGTFASRSIAPLGGTFRFFLCATARLGPVVTGGGQQSRPGYGFAKQFAHLLERVSPLWGCAGHGPCCHSPAMTRIDRIVSDTNVVDRGKRNEKGHTVSAC